MIDIFKEHPCYVLGFVSVFSLLALLAAFGSEAFLGLEPCILCVYQRWPYAVVMALGIIGLVTKKHRIALLLSAPAFLINSGIALYHTGVEQKWWKSAFEGCAVPAGFLDADEPQSILENIMSAPTANCAEIPWQDPLIGLSMANYNVIVCLGLFALCVFSFVVSGNSEKTEASHEAQNED